MSRWDALQPRQNNSNEKKRNARTTRNRTRRFDDDIGSGQSRSPSFQNRNENRGMVSDRMLHKNLSNQWNEIIERIYVQTTSQCTEYNGDLTKANIEEDIVNSNLSQHWKELRKIANECMRQGVKLSLSSRSKGRSVATLVGCCVTNSRDNWNEKSEILDVVLDLIKISNDTPVGMTAEESKTCIHHLILADTDTDQLQVDDVCRKPLECVVALLPFTAKHLSAEETANNLVKNMLVPYVLDLSHSKKRKCILAMRGLQFLLKDESRKHASAILAPLVVDVTESGEEKRIINPLHHQIVQGLTGKIIDKNVKALGVDSDSILHHACMTLTCVLNCIRSIESYDKSQRISCEPHNINIKEMESFFQKILQLPQITDEAASVPPIQANVLQLLLALLQTYPDASSVLGRLLVSQKPDSLDLISSTIPCISSSRTCQCRVSTPLMTLVHTASRLSLPAILCTEELLKTMPLHLWLTGRNQKIAPENVGQRTIGSGSLNRNMSCSVEQLLKVIRCRLQSENGHSDVLVRICHLVTCVMFTVPFCNDALINEGVKLISATSIFFVRTTDPFVLDVLGECLSECMGGRLKPQGGRTKMPIPVKKWLTSKAISRPFMNAVFANSSASQEAVTFKILGAMARTEPGISLSQSGWWEKFHDFFMNHNVRTSSVQTNLNVLTVFENILMGRKEFGTKTDLKRRTNDIVRILHLIVPEALSSISTPTSLRSATLNVYGALTEEDWGALFATSEAKGFRHIDTVLNNCTSSENNASLRSVACRALGNICTECFTSKLTETTSTISSSLSFDSAKYLCERISSTLITVLKDAAGSVRSMALFAIGNLAQTLYRLDDNCHLLSCALLTKLANMTCDCLNDSNDKVVGNAIRTSGHITLLLFERYSLQQQEIEGKNQWDGCEFYCNLLNALSGKVMTAFTEADGQTKKHTWKERSMIRKHGWGACASLALLFRCRIVTEQQKSSLLLQASKNAITSMVVCLQHVDIMNEKVIMASTSALCSISPSVWSSVSSGSSGIVGLALTPCIAELFASPPPPQQQQQQQLGPQKKKTKLKRFHQELHKLLKNLLKVGTIYDICCVLKHEIITKAMLERLYDWMIIESQQEDNEDDDNYLEASAFEVFALALQRNDIVDAMMTAGRDNNVVDLQQKFASRALERYRKEQQYQQVFILSTTAATVTTTAVSNEEPNFTDMVMEDRDKADDEDEFDEL